MPRANEANSVKNLRQRAAQTVDFLLNLIDQKISSGEWPNGHKLPTERELENEYNLSRNTLRRALRTLEDRGVITREVGRGSFVSTGSKPTDGAGPMVLLDAIIGASPNDIMEVRLLIEPPAAEFAAHRATISDLQRLELCIQRMDAATSIQEFEKWDGELHHTLMLSTKNELLYNIYGIINSARDRPEWIQLKRRTVTPARREKYQQQHRDIVKFLLQRDGAKARSTLRSHLEMIRDDLCS